MSIIAAPIQNKTLVKPFRSVCYDNNYITSQGIFIGEDPLKFSLPLLLLEVSLIFVVSNALHFILKPLGQSRVVSQTRILLGPSVIGRRNTFRETIFPIRGTFILDTISMLGLILFLFSISVKTNLSLLEHPGWRAISVGAIGSLLPFFLSLIIFFTMRNSLPEEFSDGIIIISLACRLSLSSFPVIGDALQEH